MKKQNFSRRFFIALVASLTASLSFVHAADSSFSVTGNSTTKQSLGNTQTGTVTSTGNLSTTSGTLITIDGSSLTSANQITINNSGTIKDIATSGGGRAIRDASGGSNTVINNNAGALIQSAQNDTIALNVNGSATTTASVIDVENRGTIQSLDAGTSESTTPTASGNQALNFTKTTGSNLVNNFSTGVIWATAADAVRPGLNGVIHNDGFIYSNAYQGSSSDGIDAQSDTGITIVNGYTTTTPGGTVATYQSSTALSGYVGATTSVPLTESTIEGGRHGITGGNTAETGGTVQFGGYTGDSVYAMSITNNQGGLIEGQNGSGVNIDGFGIKNANGTFSTGENVTVNNYGQIVGNGLTGDGDGIDVDGDVTINNQGSIVSENASPESTDPSGTIEFSEGVTVGGGSITNGSSTISTALIEGQNLANGAHTVGRGITLAGIDHDATTPNDNPMPIESIYENSTITNYGTIKGDSESGIAVLGTTGGGYKVTITNNSTGNIYGNNSGVSENSQIPVGTTSGDSSPNPYGGQYTGQSLNSGAIELDDSGNTYEVDNYGTIEQDGASGVAVAMHASSTTNASANALNIYGGSILGNVVGDTAADSLLTINPGAGKTFTYNYGISNFTVQVNSDGANGTVKLTSTSSNTGVTTVNAGKLDVSGSIANSAVTVGNTTLGTTATLLGDGSAGATHLLSGGTAAAGDSATVLAATQALSTNFKFTLGGLTMDGGSTLSFTLYDAAPGTGTTANPAGGTMFDLGLTGIFAEGTGVTAGSILLNFNNSEVAGTPSATNVYELAAFAPATTVSLGDFKVENLNVDGGGAYTLSYTSLTNGQEALQLTVAPEPSTYGLLGLGILGLVAVRRFRRLDA